LEPITRELIFAQAAKKLRAEFEELKATIPHAGLKGSEGEQLIRGFLDGHLPQRFRTGSGFIIDHKDLVSKQTDVIVYDALNCPIYRASETAGIYPADNVAAVVEVKSSLDKQRLEEAAANIAAAKALAKTPVPELPFLVQFETLGCVVAFETPLSLTTLAEHYIATIRKLGRLGLHIDAIAVLDVGLITLSAKVPGVPFWAPMYMQGPGGPAGEGTHLGSSAMELGEATLDAFLRFLLPHLTHFRGIVDHPGFNWSTQSTGKPVPITYLTSITFEKDPEKKKEILAKYREEVKESFAKGAE
jgi:hypothetical protein